MASVMVPLEQIAEAVQKLVAHMPTITVSVTRDLLCNRFVVGFACKACRMQWTTEAEDDAKSAEAVIGMAKGIGVSHPETQSFGDRHWCSQCPQEDRMVDGLTAVECLKLWTYNQRQADRGPFRQWPMTTAQLTAARSAWSCTLRAKQSEQRAKEREQVVCDEQWGDEL